MTVTFLPFRSLDLEVSPSNSNTHKIKQLLKRVIINNKNSYVCDFVYMGISVNCLKIIYIYIYIYI